MVIGGVASLVWGSVRTTQDIDITISVAEEDVAGLVTRASAVFEIAAQYSLEFVRQRRVLPLVTPQGVPIDLILAGLPYEEEAIQRAVVQNIGGANVKVASAEDLLCTSCWRSARGTKKMPRG